MLFRSIFIAFSLTLFAFSGSPQRASADLPSRILGYKLHHADMDLAVIAAGDSLPHKDVDLVITVTQTRIASLGIRGARAEVTGRIESLRQEAEIHFVMFRDFTVNGVPVQISELRERFSIKKKRPYQLTKPLSVEIGALQLASAATELSTKAERLRVDGTVFVFGRFKRFGFGFKRVIPLKVAFSIKNTLFD